MNVSLLFAGLAGAILVWVILLQGLKTKPWLEKGIIEAHGAVELPAPRVGLWVFLAVVTSLFGLFAIVYNMRAEFPDWRPLPDPGLLWFNTALLVLGSVALQRARWAAGKDDMATNPADAFFYVLTGLHGLHMLGGLWFLAKATVAVWRGLDSNTVTEVANVRLRVELCSVYWHYLLLIWLILFGLLIST